MSTMIRIRASDAHALEPFRVDLGVACEEWQELLKHSAVLTAYSGAVNESLALSGEEFEKARKHFDQLRAQGQSARAAMDDHERTYGCHLDSVRV